MKWTTIIPITTAVCFICVAALVQSKNKEKLPTGALRTLIRQSARWAMAARNDLNPMIAVLHANYATAYLWAANDIATDCEIEKATGLNLNKFAQSIQDVQDKATKQVADMFPDWVSAQDFLTAVSED